VTTREHKTDPFATLRLEQVLTGKGFADLDASPLQLAICRAAQGLPVADASAADELVRHFGTTELPPELPALVVLVCGVRAGKSWLASCAAIHAALTVRLDQLKRHELPRFAVIGPDVDAATATFTILRGIVESSPVLSRLLEVDPTADTLVLRRPDGRQVELCVVAAARGGRTVRNRWLAGFILEEVAQFGVEAAGAVVNAEEILRAAETRLLPGCQGWLISSPFGPQGLLYALWKEHFGKPGRVLVVHSDTRSMNPSFPQATIDAVRARDPDAAAREYDAQWVDAETSYLDSTLVDAAVRPAPIVQHPGPRAVCRCAGDFATRGNAWTVAVAAREYVDAPQAERESDAEQAVARVRVKVLATFEWIGSKQYPLSPRAVFQEMATVLAPFGIRSIKCDRWSFDAMQDHARAAGFDLAETAAGETNASYAKLKSLLGAGDLELPPTANVRTDLLGIRRKATAGGISIVLPRQASGRHCDFAPSIALAVADAASGSHGPLNLSAFAKQPPTRTGTGFWGEALSGAGSRWDGMGGRGF
jgi:hypothetical protein